MPYHQLIEVDIDQLTEEETRAYLKVIEPQRASAQTRRSVAKKTADKISGRSKGKLNISDLL